ncbi:MAG: HAD hydrolase family protein [Lachnospiraceae bacterium]|nr:HAD hydrolase family protein [Lachnospiraceae bacterium]
MAVKLFASDFDGTMYFRMQTPPISPEILTAVEELRRQGGVFGFCTGRPTGAIRGFCEGIPEYDFLIGSSGARIVDRNDELIYERHMDKETAKAIYDAGTSSGYRCAIHVEGRFTMFGADPGDMPFASWLSGWEEIGNEPIHDVSVLTPSEEAAESFTKEINQVYGADITAFQNVNSIDIVPKGCSKGEGLKLIAEIFGAEHTYGIGDSLNDIPLLDAADDSFTFHTSPAGVQKHAGIVVDTLEEAVRIAARRE